MWLWMKTKGRSTRRLILEILVFVTLDYQSLKETGTDKIRDYRADYNNRPSNSISFMSVVVRTSDHLHCEFVRILFLSTHRDTDCFFLFIWSCTKQTRTCSISSALLSYFYSHRSHTHPSHSQKFLVSHNTGTLIYLFPLTLVLSSIINKKKYEA